MQTFRAQHTESVESMPMFKAHRTQSTGPHRPAMRAPGRIVLVIREGSLWVRHEDGSQETLPAPSVVIWEPGDWVEYGSWLDEPYKTESFWSENLSHQEWAAMMTEAFRSDFMTGPSGSDGAG